MKKILIITLEHPPQIGGIATYVHQLAQALPNKELAVLAPHIVGEKKWDDRQTYPVLRRRLLFPKFIWPRWLLLYWTLWRVVRKHGFDMVYIHHVLPIGYGAVFLKKFFGIPFVIFSHGADVIFATKNTWKRYWTKKIISHAEHIVVNSESLQRRLLEKLPEAEKKTSVIYPCPEKTFLEKPDQDAVDILRAQLALEGKKVMLSVGRLAEGKGFPHIARHLPEVMKKVPNIVWIIVGDGPKRDYILKEIQRYNLQNVVRFVGEVPHDQLRVYYQLADIFVLLTHPDLGFEEGLGLVFLEAAANALPVVAGRSGGVEEAVLHSKTGLVVDTYQDISVTSAITTLLTNDMFAAELGTAAQNRIRSEFQWQHQLKKLEQWM